MTPPNITPTDVKQAIARVQALSDANWYSLNEPIRLMYEEAWVGPSGDRYIGVLKGQQQHMQRAFRNALDELNSLLKKVTQQEVQEKANQNGQVGGSNLGYP